MTWWDDPTATVPMSEMARSAEEDEDTRGGRVGEEDKRKKKSRRKEKEKEREDVEEEEQGGRGEG